MPKTLAKAKSPIRRHVRIEARNGSQIISSVKSFTKDDGTTYHPSIDIETLEFFCDCEDHRYRHHFCKHLRKNAHNLIRRGELDSSFLARNCGESCCRCGKTQSKRSLFPMCHDDGSHMEGVVICYPCIEELRAEQIGVANAPIPQDAADDEPFDMEVQKEFDIESERLMMGADVLEQEHGMGFSADYQRRYVAHHQHLAQKNSSPVQEDAEKAKVEATPTHEFCVCGRKYPFQFGKAFCVSCRATTDVAHATALQDEKVSGHPDGEDDGGPYRLAPAPGAGKYALLGEPLFTELAL